MTPPRFRVPLSDLAVRILEELEDAGGKLSEAELRRRPKIAAASSFALEQAFKQLHTAYLCAWGFDAAVGAIYQLLTDGRMRLFHEKTARGAYPQIHA